jgi:hypothetical protein
MKKQAAKACWARKAKTEQAARRAAALLEERFATLSKVGRNKARKELHKPAPRFLAALAEKFGEARCVLVQPVPAQKPNKLSLAPMLEYS